MSSAASRVLIMESGEALFPGIDYEGAKLTVHYRTRDVLVVKIGGGSGWAGIGMPRAYRPAHFGVYNLIGKGTETTYLGRRGTMYGCTQIVEFQIKPEKEEPPDVSRRKFGRRYP